MTEESSLKDFVDHLRTVHFSLVAAALGLLLVVNSPGPRELVDARTQIKDIINATDEKKWDHKFLNNLAQPAVKEAKLDSSEMPCMTIEWSHYSGPFDAPKATLVFDRPRWAISGISKQSRDLGYGRASSQIPLSAAEETHEDCAPPSGGFAGRFVEAPETLKEFETLWNDLRHAAIYSNIELDHNIFFTEGTRLISKPYSWKEIPTNLDIKSVTLQLVALTSDESDSLGRDFNNARFKFALRGGFNYGRYRVYIPVSFTHEPIALDGLSYFTARHPDWRPGEFNDTFAELNRTTEGLPDDTSLQMTRNVIEWRLAQAKDSFEALGIKFPSETTLHWGPVLIIGIQLYLWLHLRRLKDLRHLGPVPLGVAWIGAYTTWFARCVFVFSAFLLPFFVIGFIAVYKARDALPILLCIVSGFLAVMAFESHRKFLSWSAQ